MKGCCPQCGHAAHMQTFADEAMARQCMAMAFEWPMPLADRLMRYLGLFRPSKRALAWPRVLRLMEPLAADMKRGFITRHKRDWAAPQDAWAYAFDVVFEQLAKGTLTLPLKDHGYLYGVIANRSDGHEAKAESKAHTELQKARKPKPGDTQTHPFNPQEKSQAERAEQNRRRLAHSELIQEEEADLRSNLPAWTDAKRREFLQTKGLDAAGVEAVLRNINKELK